MQEELPWNLAEGAANPYPLAVKPRDIPSNKRDMQLIKIKYCVDTFYQKAEKAWERRKNLLLPRLFEHHETLHTILPTRRSNRHQLQQPHKEPTPQPRSYWPQHSWKMKPTCDQIRNKSRRDIEYIPHKYLSNTMH